MKIFVKYEKKCIEEIEKHNMIFLYDIKKSTYYNLFNYKMKNYFTILVKKQKILNKKLRKFDQNIIKIIINLLFII